MTTWLFVEMVLSGCAQPSLKTHSGIRICPGGHYKDAT